MSELKQLKQQALQDIKNTDAIKELNDLKIKYLGKKGLVTSQMKSIGSLPAEKRREFGASINIVKQEVSDAIDDKAKTLETELLQLRFKNETLDVTLPVRERKNGSVHPISQVIEEAVNIFAQMGFAVAEGPEIEDDFHNFTALNIPPNHPARQMQDSFYLDGSSPEEAPFVLRTHTSSVQVRAMQNGKPPFKLIAPGRVYRSDYDATHTPMFHQIEGLYIDKDINMGHLKGCLQNFLSSFFETEDLPIRFRPSFFPFTEPSAEVDIGCLRADGTVTIGHGQDWLEILGCGMVHPNVLGNVGIDPEEYQGFAFGLGIERLAMLKYGAPDLRSFFDSDVRWLEHYSFGALDIPSLIGGL